MFSLNANVLATFVIYCSVSLVTSQESFDEIFKISEDIYERRDTITPDEVVSNLMQIKALRPIVANPVRIDVPNRERVMIGLCLHKLVMELNIERCMQGTGHYSRLYYHDNYQSNNYIDNAARLREHFKDSENMLKFIESHYELQLTICIHNILGNFATKLETIWFHHDATSMKVFQEKLLASFTKQLDRVATMTFDEKVDGVVRLLLDFYDRDDLFNRMIGAELLPAIKQLVDTYCKKFYLSPLKTLVMTYEVMGRNSPKVEKNFGQSILAYDICFSLRDQFNFNFMDEIKLRLSRILQMPVYGKRHYNSDVSPAEIVDSRRPAKRARLAEPTNLITQTQFEGDPIDNTPREPQSDRRNDLDLELRIQPGHATSELQQGQLKQNTSLVPKKGLTFDLSHGSHRQDDQANDR